MSIIEMSEAMKRVEQGTATWDGYMNQTPNSGINNFYRILVNYDTQTVDHVFVGNDAPEIDDCIQGE